LRTLGRGFDIVHFHALGPGVFSPLPRVLSGAKVVQTIHGLDDERGKWGRASRSFLRLARAASERVPDATVGVSRALAALYGGRGRDATYIPNGIVEPDIRPARLITKQFGLQGGDYVLWVGRLVPEKAPDLLVKAFAMVPHDVRLVIAGGSSFTDEYAKTVEDLAARDPRVLMTGFVFGEVLSELYSNAAAFVIPSRLEGLPLTLLEAVSYGLPVVASDIPPHLEVLYEDGPGRRIHDVDDPISLAASIRAVLGGVENERAGAHAVRERVVQHYSWDDAAERTEALYLRLVNGAPSKSSAAEPGGSTPPAGDHRVARIS
jgi:glycosyltransferase involved in cell wall biosynthesis